MAARASFSLHQLQYTEILHRFLSQRSVQRDSVQTVSYTHLKDASVLKLFADYTVSKPQFSKSSGKYGETIELSIDADSDTKYTIHMIRMIL